jgi:hypothetical protein
VILHCTFEELSALAAGVERVLTSADDAAVMVAAPPQIVADLEALTPRLTGDLTVGTLRISGASRGQQPTFWPT